MKVLVLRREGFQLTVPSQFRQMIRKLFFTNSICHTTRSDSAKHHLCYFVYSRSFSGRYTLLLIVIIIPTRCLVRYTQMWGRYVTLCNQFICHEEQIYPSGLYLLCEFQDCANHVTPSMSEVIHVALYTLIGPKFVWCLCISNIPVCKFLLLYFKGWDCNI